MINLKEFFAEDSDYYQIFNADQKRVKENYKLMFEIIRYIDTEIKDRKLDSMITTLYERIEDELATTDI